MLTFRAANRVAIAIVVAAAGLLIARNLTWLPSTVQLFRGDPVSERNVVMALAEWAPPASVWDNCLLPTYRSQHTVSDKRFFQSYVYTHFPPFSELLHWMQRCAGVRTVRGLRWAPIALNLAALYVLFLAFSAWRDPLFGLLAMTAWCLRPAFWEGADNLHVLAFHAPQQAMLFGGLVLADRGREAAGALLAWTAAFWQGLLGFEYQLLTLAIVAAFWAGSVAPRRRWPLYLAIATGGPLAFALHVVQNALHLGSLSAAVADLGGAAARRSAGDASEAGRSWLAFASETYRRHRAYIGGTLALPVGAAGVLAALDRARPRRATLLWFALAAGSFVWFALMRSIVFEQIVLMSRVLMPLLALSYAAAGYALFQVFARWRREPGWRAALAVLALAAVNVAIWRPLAAGDAAYLRRELDMAALRSAPNDEITPQLWHVQRSRGFFGFPVGLLGDGIPPAMRYRTVQCPADDELCGNSRQTLAVAFASPVQMRAVTVSVRNGRPERPIVVRLLLPDEDGNNPGATLFAGEANEPGADGTWRIALSSPVRRRLLLLEFEAALPRDFEIERVRFE